MPMSTKPFITSGSVIADLLGGVVSDLFGKDKAPTAPSPGHRKLLYRRNTL